MTNKIYHKHFMHPFFFFITSVFVLESFTTTTALVWSSMQPPNSLGKHTSNSKCSNKERQALLHFKSYTRNDFHGLLTTWTSEEASDCCYWSGVTCNNHSRVTSLNLAGGFIGGKISPSLLNLSYLNYLDLSDNFFNGTIPMFIGSMTQLRYLYLGWNDFTGIIPSELGNLTNLQALSLGSFSGCKIENLNWLSHLSLLDDLVMSVMSALDFMKSDDTSDVVFKDVEASGDGNVVEKGKVGRFEGGDYAGVGSIKGFSKAPLPRSTTRQSSRKLLRSAATSSSHEPVDVSDDIQASDDQSFEVEQDKELEVARKRKAAGKRTVSPTVQGLGDGDVYVPAWKVKVGDLLKTPEVCRDALSHFAPPPLRNIVSKMEGIALMNRLVTSVANLTPLLAEGVTRFENGMDEYERFKAVKEEMTASMVAMKKSLDEYAEKKKVHEEKVKGLLIDHEVELASLSEEVDRLKGENKWLIEHGFQQVVAYLLHSSEFNSVLGGVYDKLLNVGKHLGLLAGYDLCKAGEPVENSPMFDEAAHERFVRSVNVMEKLTYPYVGAVSACYDKPLSVLQGLKPEGLKEKAAQDVIDSIAKKRSHSGDSDEALSGDGGSQAGSLEASAVADVASPAAKPKKKKKKITKASTSKPPTDV